MVPGGLGGGGRAGVAVKKPTEYKFRYVGPDAVTITFDTHAFIEWAEPLLSFAREALERDKRPRGEHITIATIPVTRTDEQSQ